MKIKFPTSIVVDVDTPFLNAFEIRMESLIKFLKPLGYMGMELKITEPEKIPIKLFNQLLDSYQMKISALGTGGTYTRMGYALSSNDDKIRQKAIERLGIYAGLVTEIQDPPKIIIGLIRGHNSIGQLKNDAMQHLTKSLIEIDSICRDIGTQAVLEPINRFETDTVHTLEEAITLIQNNNLENIFPMVDTFQMNIEEDMEYIYDKLGLHAKFIKHVHIASCNRREPAQGCINFKKLINSLVENGYWGYFSLSTVMKPSFEAMARRSAEFLSKII